jgi:hypothetical protein
MNKIFSVLCILASSALLYAEEVKLLPEVVQLFQDAPKLKQNLRRFDTLGMEVTEEIFEDGKWNLRWTERYTNDRRKNLLRTKSVLPRNARQMHNYMDSVRSQDKFDRLLARLYDTEKDPFEPERLSEASMGIYNPHEFDGPNSSDLAFTMFPGTGAHFEWLYSNGDRKGRTLLEILQDKEYQDGRRLKIKPQGTGLVVVQIEEDGQYYIDLSKGMPVKYAQLLAKEDGSLEEYRTYEVTEFMLKDGWFFPITILTTEKGVSILRQKINPKTLEINKLLSPNDFAVKIYPGTRIHDFIENKEYIAGQEMTSANIKELETQLKNFAEEVRKSREKSKSEAKEKKEQQKKEKQ